MGTRVGDAYEWLTFKEVDEIAKNLSFGMLSMDMIPDIQAEGRPWRFIGIQSKNRKEWYLTHIADMF